MYFFVLFLLFLCFTFKKSQISPQYLHIYNAQSDIRTDEREVASWINRATLLPQHQMVVYSNQWWSLEWMNTCGHWYHFGGGWTDGYDIFLIPGCCLGQGGTLQGFQPACWRSCTEESVGCWASCFGVSPSRDLLRWLWQMVEVLSACGECFSQIVLLFSAPFQSFQCLFDGGGPRRWSSTPTLVWL